METALTYIEANLKTDITAEELSSLAGYSLYHFYRLFALATGCGVMEYIRKRRLECALAEIADGRTAIDAVLEYGFDTYAGFYKAFVKMYGCSPKKYLSIYHSHIPNMKTEIKTMYTQTQLRQILDNWDIPSTLPIEDIYIMDGAKVSGNVWKVGSGYFLKTTAPNRADRVQLLKNIKIAKALQAQGFSAAVPIKTKSGAEYLDGENPFVLTAGISGAPLDRANRFGEKHEAYAQKYGRSIARLHTALKEVEDDILPDELNLYSHVAEWALPNVKLQNQQWNLGLSDEFFEDYLAGFGTLYDALPKQLIHRDPNPSNVLFDGGEVSGFIDFDLGERNVRLFDPCYCATGILSEWRGIEDIYKKWPDILRGILHGYDRVSPLSAEEKRSVFYVLCSIEMICVSYFASVDEYRELAQTNREMLQFIVRSRSAIDAIWS